MPYITVIKLESGFASESSLGYCLGTINKIIMSLRNFPISFSVSFNFPTLNFMTLVARSSTSESDRHFPYLPAVSDYKHQEKEKDNSQAFNGLLTRECW